MAFKTDKGYKRNIGQVLYDRNMLTPIGFDELNRTNITDLQISAQESLEEASLPTAPFSQDITAEHAALSLFLL